MGAKRKKQQVSILPRAMRIRNRNKQIDVIKAEIRKRYRDRIRTAATKEQRRELKAERDAEIAKHIEPLIREGDLDTPECL